MIKNNKYIPHSQITLVPGLAKAILQKKKVKEFEFYGYLKSSQSSGCIKDYDLIIINFETGLSVKTIKRRLQSLQDLGWIDIKKGDIYVRSIRKVCETVDCFYNDFKPRKERFTSSKINTAKEVLRIESLKEHINHQKHNFITRAKDTSKSVSKLFETFPGTDDIKMWLLNSKEEIEAHSHLLTGMDITASRDKCAELWNCSKMDASRTLMELAKKGVITDEKRAGYLKDGSHAEAETMKKIYNDPTIFHKKGKIYKKLRNKITFMKIENNQRIKDELYKGSEDWNGKILFRLNMMYNSYLSKVSLRGGVQ